MKKELLIPLIIVLSLLVGTTIVVLYGRGYRFGFSPNGRPEILGTGLLVATSMPDGAGVYINDHLTTATDNTINLAPGEYNVKIVKDGYFPWVKRVKVQEEVVSKTQALLFPKAPKLGNITSIGIKDAVIDPSFTKIAYTVASVSARKNGIYILDMTNKPILTLQSASKQIVDDTFDTFSQSSISWSPDGTQILAGVPNQKRTQTSYYLVNTNSSNQNPKDVTATLQSVKAVWDQERQEKERANLSVLKPGLRKTILKNFKNPRFSYDESKILYEASTSAELPIIISPRLIGTNPTEEERLLKKGQIYAYDIKEDKNYKILDEEEAKNKELLLAWFSDSNHMVRVFDRKIEVMDYDGTNRTTVYAGPFVDNYVFPWPNESKLLIVTTLGNPDIPPNLYTIELK